ncbi:MAG: hypothetical protein ACTSPX_01170 [Candidatus Thorarchaeota archaeon]
MNKDQPLWHTTQSQMLQVQYNISNEIAATRETLINVLYDLAETLSQEANRLRNLDAYVPNELGVVQGRGATIDNLIAKYAALKSCLCQLQGIPSTEAPTEVTWETVVEEAKKFNAKK